MTDYAYLCASGAIAAPARRRPRILRQIAGIVALSSLLGAALFGVTCGVLALGWAI